MATDSGPDLIGYLNRITAKYDLQADAFLDLFAAQEHRCAICRKGLVLFAEALSEAPVVDHDHETGAVRGIVCRGCNTAVGYIEKDRVRTRRVLGYLKKHKARGGGWVNARKFEKVFDTDPAAD